MVGFHFESHLNKQLAFLRVPLWTGQGSLSGKGVDIDGELDGMKRRAKGGISFTVKAND